jgi:hypothetical protein
MLLVVRVKDMGDVYFNQETERSFIIISWEGYIMEMLVIIQFKNCYHLFTFKHVEGDIWDAVISPFLLYECETWSVALREEQTYKFRRARSSGYYLDLKEDK